MWETCQDVWISVPCAFAYGTGQTQGEGTPESVVKSVAPGHMAAKCPRKAHVLPGAPFVGALALRSVPWLSSSSGDLRASVQGPLLPTLYVGGLVRREDTSASCPATQAGMASFPSGGAWAEQRSRGLLQPSSFSSSSSSLCSALAVGRSCLAGSSSNGSR